MTMSHSIPSRSSSCKMGNRGKNGTAKGRKLLLAAVCASLTPPSSAFTALDSVRKPVHLVSGASSRSPNEPSSTSSSSSALPSSPNDDVHFFTAVSQPLDNEGYDKKNSKRKLEANSEMVSTEQAEPEAMEISDTTTEEEEDLLSTISVVAAATASSSLASEARTPAVFMDVDGNGTGALMNRSVAAGGVHAPLMATNPSLAFPIDSGKEGMHAETTRARTQTPLNDGIIDQVLPKTRLVRYSLPPSESSKLGPNQKMLVSASGSSQTGRSEIVRSQSPKSDPRLQSPKPRLVRYNGPDVEDSTDYEGMELPSIKENRDRQLKLQRANLVRYTGASQQKPLTEEVANNNSDIDGSGTVQDHQRNRKNLVEDPGYANRYTRLSDFNLARKTGLAVNKPISLWVERDKFL